MICQLLINHSDCSEASLPCYAAQHIVIQETTPIQDLGHSCYPREQRVRGTWTVCPTSNQEGTEQSNLNHSMGQQL